MLEKLKLFKSKLNQPALDELVLGEVKTVKLQITDTIMKLARKKSSNRKKRYHLRTKRLTRMGNLA